jgi:leader peptidase (prepilin peptidase)/N-methyltransferase
MHPGRRPVRYLASVDSLLVAGVSAAGLVIGGALDPVGQRLADSSRLEDERRRASQAPAPATAVEPPEGPMAAPAHLEEAVPAAWQAAGSDDADGPAAVVGAGLEAQGNAPGRTAAAAVITGALFGGAAAHFGSHVVLAPFCVFFALLVAVSFTDLSHRLVPRRLIYGALALIVPLLVVAAAVDDGFGGLTGAAIAGAVAFAVFFALWWFIPRGMGFGDVRLAGAIGLTVGYLSLLHAYVAFLAGFVIGMVFGLATMVLSGAGRRTRIPFAPSLAAGAVIAVFWGGQLAHDLFHTAS